MQKYVKKTVALFLVVVLVCGAVPVAFAAVSSEPEPIIMIAGFASTQLFAQPDDPEQREHVWDLNFNAIGDEVLRELPGLLGGLLVWMVTGWTGMASWAFARAAERVVGFLAMTPEGTPAHDVGHFPGGAADYSLAAIRANEDPNARFMQQLGSFARRFEEYVGAGRIFIFQYDWRQSNVESARQLRAFIQDVKSLTGSETVRIFGSSYGGQLAGVYLADYAADRDVSKVVVEVPAFGGSSMIPDLLMGQNFQVNIGTLLRFMESYNYGEGGLQLDWLLGLIPQQWLAPLATDLLLAGLLPIVRGWGGLWDLVPAADYEETKAAVFASDEDWYFSGDSDRLHREIMPRWGEILRSAQDEHGIAVRIVANTGNLQLVGQIGENSDGLLDVKYTTGARTALLGERLTYGERLSPGQDIDASIAWLPDHTWFIQGQFHGASWGDPYGFELLSALMLDTSLNTVYCDPAFPQFGLSRSPSEDIYASFDVSLPGFLSEGDSMLRIENLTRHHDIRVLSVGINGLDFELKRGTELAPGESLQLNFSGALSSSYAPLTVKYLLVPIEGGLPVPKQKIFDVSVIC